MSLAVSYSRMEMDLELPVPENEKLIAALKTLGMEKISQVFQAAYCREFPQGNPVPTISCERLSATRNLHQIHVGYASKEAALGFIREYGKEVASSMKEVWQ